MNATKQANRNCNIRNSQDAKYIASRSIDLTSVVVVSTVDPISSVLSLETKWNKHQQCQARGLFEETLSPPDIGHQTGLIGFDMPGEFTNPKENCISSRQPSAEKATMSQVWLNAKAEPIKYGTKLTLVRGQAWHDAKHAENQRTAQSAVSRHTTEKSRHIRPAVFKSI